MQVYPNAHHATFTVHLWRNINASFKSKRLAGLVSRAARAFTISEFNKLFLKIQRINPGCATYLVDIGEEGNSIFHKIYYVYFLIVYTTYCTYKYFIFQVGFEHWTRAHFV